MKVKNVHNSHHLRTKITQYSTIQRPIIKINRACHQKLRCACNSRKTAFSCRFHVKTWQINYISLFYFCRYETTEWLRECAKRFIGFTASFNSHDSEGNLSWQKKAQWHGASGRSGLCCPGQPKLMSGAVVVPGESSQDSHYCSRAEKSQRTLWESTSCTAKDAAHTLS